MIDIAKLKYKLIALLETGEKLDITDVCEEITWQEFESEFSVRITFSAYNTRMKDGRWLPEKLRLNCILAVYSNYSGTWEEVARGTLHSWEPEETNKTCILDGEANDILYDLQKSQEYRYVTDGTKTDDIIKTIFEDWGITLGTYEGPSEKHSKTAYKSDYVGDILCDILSEAKKKGARKCFIRARGNVVDVIPRGTNSVIYSLRADTNVTDVSAKISTQNIVTRVVVLSKANDDARQSIEATVDGRTEYGIKQKIITRGSDESLEDARKTAQEELDENGKPEREYKLSGLPDIPPLRKGDKIKIHAGALDDFYYVKSITHYASSRTMTIQVEEIDDQELAEQEAGSKEEVSQETFKKGDRVILNGAVYLDSYGIGRGQTFNNYEGTITMQVPTDRECPYHIDAIGWVYPNSITKI